MQKKIIIPEYEELKELLLSIKQPLARALCCYLYAGCARKGEIVRPDYWHAPKRKGEPSIQEKDIFYKTEKFGRRLYLRVKSTKRGTKTAYRLVPLNPNKEKWLCNELIHWKDMFKSYVPVMNVKNRLPNELFPFSPGYAYKLVTRYCEFNPHLFRHARATHYLTGEVTGNPLSPDYVAKIGGWMNINTLYKTYSHALMGQVSEAV